MLLNCVVWVVARQKRYIYFGIIGRAGNESMCILRCSSSLAENLIIILFP
jgi:hypothetical protein